MKAELTQLIDLQNLDTSIRRLKAELEAIPQRRAEIEKEFEQRAAEFLTLENRRDEARRDIPFEALPFACNGPKGPDAARR